MPPCTTARRPWSQSRLSTRPAGAERDVSLSLVAALPGSYTGPASRAYLYYTDEHKRWADPLKVSIEPLADDAADDAESK